MLQGLVPAEVFFFPLPLTVRLTALANYIASGGGIAVTHNGCAAISVCTFRNDFCSCHVIHEGGILSVKSILLLSDGLLL